MQGRIVGLNALAGSADLAASIEVDGVKPLAGADLAHRTLS
jgi:hypothetical protein